MKTNKHRLALLGLTGGVLVPAIIEQCRAADPPLMEIYPCQTAIQGSAFVGATPMLHDPLISAQWSLSNAPAGMTIDPVTGTPSWPNPAEGRFTIAICATNTSGMDAMEWILNVVHTNYGSFKILSTRSVDFVMPDWYAVWLERNLPYKLVDQEYDRIRQLTGVETDEGKQVVFFDADAGGGAWSGQPVHIGPGWMSDPWSYVGNLMVHEIGHNFNGVMGMPSGGYFGWFDDVFHHGAEMVEQPVMSGCRSVIGELELDYEARQGFIGHVQSVDQFAYSRYTNYSAWVAAGNRATNYTSDPYGIWAGICYQLRQQYGPAILEKTVRAWRREGLPTSIRNLADTSPRRMTLLFCIMSAAAGTDLRQYFYTNGLDVDDAFYLQISNQVFTTVANLPNEDVSGGWKKCPLNNHYYKLTAWSTTWDFAERQARTLGGHLATVRSTEEEQWLQSRFGYRTPLWIGLTDAAQEGTWRWISGESSTYRFWDSREPNGGTGENYALMFWYPTGEWVDCSGNARFKAIMEVTNSPPSPAQPEITLLAPKWLLREDSSQPAEFRIIASTNGPHQVQLHVSGTATEGLDYTALNHTVIIPAGTNETTVPVYAVQDNLAEGMEKVVVTITNFAGRVWPRGSAEVCLLDDEYPAGAFKRQVWPNIGYSAGVSVLTNNSRYPNSPDTVEFIPAMEPEYLKGDSGEAYGQRISGYLVPPATGTYTFYVCSDNDSQLWLSTNTSPANRRLIAKLDGYTGFRQYLDLASQASAPVLLQQNHWYYIEVLHKEDWGGDHVSATWTLAGANPMRGTAPISSEYVVAGFPTAWPAPELSLVPSAPAGLALRLQSKAALESVIEASDSLISGWTPVATNQPGTQTALSVLDPGGAGHGQRFYRAKLLLP